MDEILFFIVTSFLRSGILLVLGCFTDANRACFEPLPQKVIIISSIVIAIGFIVFVCLAVTYIKKKRRIGVLYIPAWISTIGWYWFVIDSFDYIKVPDPLPDFEGLYIIMQMTYLCIISVLIYCVVWIICKLLCKHKDKKQKTEE